LPGARSKKPFLTLNQAHDISLAKLKLLGVKGLKIRIGFDLLLQGAVFVL
jgi:hypothetical protein